MSRGAHLLHAVYGSFWAMTESKLDAMLAFLDEYSAGARFSADEIRARVGEPRVKSTAPAGSGVAVLPVYGLISHRAHMVQNISGPGGTSTELLGQEFDQAMADPKIGTIVLDVDSPGGNVAGVQELADKIRAARGQKRVIAVANSLAASAAYWIAAAADDFVVTPSGEVGSIGVYAIHTDTSVRDHALGVKRTILKAGRRKAEGNPFGPMDEEAKAYAQQQIDEYYDAFTQAVAQSRGVSVAVARGPQFGEGRTMTARQAVANGLADRVGTLEQVLEELGVGGGRQAAPIRGGKKAALDPDRIGTDAPLQRAATPFRLTALTLDGERVAINDPRVIDLYVETLAGESARELDAFTDRVMAKIRHALDISTDAEERQGASASEAPALDSPAPKAKEHPVVETNTAAPPTPGATNELAQLRAEMDRQAQIRALASLVPNVSAAEVDQLITSNASVEQARTAFRAKIGQPQAVSGVRMGADREAERPFASLGEQLVAIVQAGKPGGRRDPRLSHINAAASGMNESVGSEGGFFLQADVVADAMKPVYTDDPLLQRVKRVPIAAGRNGIKYHVVDETSRATGSRWGGIQMYWAAEADTVTAKKPKTRLFALDLKKLMGIGYITEELQEDAPAAGSLLSDAFLAESRFMLGDGIFRGLGNGQMLGFMNAGCVVSQAIESTQTIANTDTFIAKNTSKMLARVPANLQGDAIWLYNPEFLPALVTATVGNCPVFVGAGGISARPYDTIWGRPAFASDLCEAVGTPGDIVCAVPSEYHMAVRDENATIASSMHVRFIYDENCIKITQRVDGAPVWNSAVTPYKGAATRSPFITLATRS